MRAPNLGDVFRERSARFELACAECGAIADAPSVKSLYCQCDGIYDIRYHSPVDAVAGSPLAYPGETLDLGQGNTPTIRLEGLASDLGVSEVWAKLEYCSPTGSFKDRGSAVLVAAAVEEGVREFVEDSSGNAGASMAAYAARAGLKAHIFAPSSAAQGKLDQIRIFGAELHLVDGPRHASTDAATEFASKYDVPYLSHALSPWFAEGVKQFALELKHDPNVRPTDVVMPAGNGALLIGGHAGFDGITSPRLHGVQSEHVQPLLRAIAGQRWHVEDVSPTVASGISVAQPPRVNQAANAVLASGGSGVAVSDLAMLRWQARLAAESGIFCEVTSAAAFAGLEKMVDEGAIKRESRVVVVVTGSGLKEPLTR